MNEQEKSLALAELMDWKVDIYKHIESDDLANGLYLDPYLEYDSCCDGCAIFGIIMVKFPEAMAVFSIALETRDDPQTWLLDELLRMKGKWVE